MTVKRYELNEAQWSRIAALVPGKVGDPGRTGSDMLLDEGCVVVDIAATLPKAISAVEDENNRLDGAVLDVNLGGEKVFPAAEILTARGIPFIFATGYGIAGIDAQFSGVPVLAKPYRSAELKEALCSALDC